MRYDYRCEFCGLEQEAVFPMGEAPRELQCQCEAMAHRVYTPPAAIHFHGPGFYSTDVRGTTRRKRRRNAGDDLYIANQPDSEAIAKAI